jgi:hypothetical protein
MAAAPIIFSSLQPVRATVTSMSAKYLFMASPLAAFLTNAITRYVPVSTQRKLPLLLVFLLICFSGAAL